MIGPIVFGAIDAAFAIAEGGVRVYDRARLFWRTVRPPEPPKPVPGALSYRDLEHQRDQMRAATTRGTVTGPAHAATPMPDTVRSTPLPPRG